MEMPSTWRAEKRAAVVCGLSHSGVHGKIRVDIAWLADVYRLSYDWHRQRKIRCIVKSKQKCGKVTCENMKILQLIKVRLMENLLSHCFLFSSIKDLLLCMSALCRTSDVEPARVLDSTV
jgi:hypothetical protein